MAHAVTLSKRCIQAIKKPDGDFTQPLILKVSSIQPRDNNKHVAMLSDGEDEIQAVLASQLSNLVQNGTFLRGATIKLINYTPNVQSSNGWVVLMVTDLEVLAAPPEGEKLGTPITTGRTSPLAELRNKGGMGSPMTTPSMLVKSEVRSWQQIGPTPPSAAAPIAISSRTSGFTRISGLHPYDDQWKIRAKLARKGPLRSLKIKGADTSVMTIELVDDEGTQIQATAWRAQAERWAASLQEGRVYCFERFQVKPANKQYAAVRNDYEITLTDKTDVQEAADQEVGTAMAPALEYVPIDGLPRYITRKMPVDVIGIVTALGAAGTVKRKSDSSEVARRDITLADTSGKTVVLTLWGDSVNQAVDLDGREGQAIVQCSSCRVIAWNGCSLSALSRSVLTINPEVKQTKELQQWWAATGNQMMLQPIGGDATAQTPGGLSARDQLHYAKDVVDQPIPDLDAKPVYHNLIATVVKLNPEQAMYYLANPETGRKVVEQDGRYYSDADGKFCDRPSYRYIMSLTIMDSSADVPVSLFNEQAETVLGYTADDMAAKKDQDESTYVARCKAAQWTEWAVTLSTKSREYQGDRKMRHTVFSVRPISYTQDGYRLLSQIDKCT